MHPIQLLDLMMHLIYPHDSQNSHEAPVTPDVTDPQNASHSHDYSFDAIICTHITRHFFTFFLLLKF